jgi:hypothetical protein
VIEHAGEGLRAILDPPRPTAFTYVEGSLVGLIAIVVAVAAVPDAVFFWLLIPHRLSWLALGLDAADIWGALWLFGLYGTMARSPHTLEGERVTLHNGALQSLAFNRNDVAETTSLGVVKRRALPRKRGDGSLVLAFGGVPIVDVRFKIPTNGFTRVFVASDRPEALCAVLRPSSPP